MAYRILSTKLYSPPIKPGLVRRPRLVEKLENGYQAGKRITLVSASAGFGKTTVISEWIASTDPNKPFGWVSLDEDDNDPVRFLMYLVSAIQKVHEQIGQSVLTLLQSSQISNLTDLLEALINEISAASTPFIIVLDDYHQIKNLEVHALMQLFLQRQPDKLHLILITREDPPLPIPRLRVQGQVTEVRERDLRFTLAEAQAFLVGAMSIDLSLEEVGKLTERTEGWAAGMQLAALALEEFPDNEERRSFIEAFAGSNRLIVDYLISEVLQRQPETTQRFLLCSSILERFCADLCDQVVFADQNTNRSQQILDSLEQGNMFLVPLDNQRHWYRYHHLFSEMLSHSLRRSMSEQVPNLHRRASEWFEARGLIPEAVKHAAAYGAAGEDWGFAKALLDRYAMPLLFQGQGNLVMGWCREFPKAYLEQAPEICIYFAWGLVLTFREDFLDAVEEKLQTAERGAEKYVLPQDVHIVDGGNAAPLKDWINGQVCVVRSQILLGHFNRYVDPQDLIDLSLKGLDLLPDVEKGIRATCKINLALAQLMQNQPEEAGKAFEEALPFELEARNYLSAVTTIFYQARLAFYQGQLARAEMLCRHWKRMFTEMAGSTPTGGGMTAEIPAIRGLDIVESLLLLDRGQLDEAESLLVRTLELLGWASWMELHGFIVLAHLRHLRGNDAGVQETLQRMSRLGPQHAACAEALLVLFKIQRSLDDPQVRHTAETWTRKNAPDAVEQFSLGIGPYHRDTEYFCNLAWSRVQIALGHYQEAATFIRPALQSAKDHGLLFRVVELSIAQALVDDGLGDPTAALAELGKALEISESAGYARVFDDGPGLDRLLHQCLVKNIHPQFVKQLLATFIRTPLNRKQAGEKTARSALMNDQWQEAMVEPLSEREVEVLRMLASGLAPVEVAKRLYLSPHTLKAHTQNIYTKLDVHSRVEAINKARELGLL
jgi:LuxR family transcriptional regulator, maltose regulon positive regulatory protein